jgi:putative peptide zinc metalloprotease protein
MADRLSGSVVAVRADLDVSRHLFRGEPAYVVRDPISFQSHRLTIDEYRVLVAIDCDRTLGESFAALVDDGSLDPDDEETYYSFVVGLHRMGLLTLPIDIGKTLYGRFERRRAAQRKALAFAFVSLKVPLVNPAAFLDRTAWVARLAFSRWAAVAWLIVVGTGLYVAISNRDQVAAPLVGALEFESLPILWVVLVVLKLAHELGHAYACKRFGVTVPEMGVLMILGTPCAYVDATDCWRLPDVRQRMIVNLAGMYVEGFFAALGVMVWAATDPGLLNTVAYQTALLASVVTIGFNINPLARFDGYYVLSDLVGVPNLRKRAGDEVAALFDRWILGIRRPGFGGGPLATLGLVTFGIASAFYKVSLTLGIATVIAMKAFGLGIVLAILVAGSALVKAGTAFIKHMWFSEITAPARIRSVVASVVIVAGASAAVLSLPLPVTFRADGVLSRAEESTVRARTPGFITEVIPASGDRVDAGNLLVRLDNIDVKLAALDAAAAVDENEVYARLAVAEGAAESVTAQERLRHARGQAVATASTLADLTLPAAFDGEVISTPAGDLIGKLVGVGDELAVIARGGWSIIVPVDAETLSTLSPAVGDAVTCRLRVAPRMELRGRIARIEARGERVVREKSLTQRGGGSIPVRGENGETGAPYFHVVVDLLDVPEMASLRGSRARVQFGTAYRTTADALTDAVLRLIDGLRTSS